MFPNVLAIPLLNYTNVPEKPRREKCSSIFVANVVGR